jgi:hypothetical protein
LLVDFYNKLQVFLPQSYAVLRGRPSVNKRVSLRVNKIEEILRTDLSRTRRRVICHLEEIFYIASDYARGRIYRVASENGKVRPLTIAERRIWTHVDEFTIMIIGDVRNGIDERQLEEALSKLETIVDQVATSEKID